jgi:Sulfotransferase domain
VLSHGALPNVIVIGAAKCGTTSLHTYLDLHPDISMSREKELNFFVEEKNWHRGVAWYREQFRAAAIRGESSPAYSAFPLYRGVAERMRLTVPDARILYVVRDPVERIVSHYLHRTLNWPDMGSLDCSLASAKLREWFLAPSRYWSQLQCYLAEFPPDAIRVVDTDDLETRRGETLASIFRFLGVDASFQALDHAERHNVAIGSRRPTHAGRQVSQLTEKVIGRRAAQRLRERAPAALKSRLQVPVGRPEVSSELRAELEHELRPEVERLRTFTGLAFAGWSL